MKFFVLIFGFLPLLSVAQEVSRNSNIETWDTYSLCKVANHPTEGYRVRVLLRSRGAACVSREESSNSGSFQSSIAQEVSRNSNIETWDTYSLCKVVNHPTEGYRVRALLRTRGAACVSREESSNTVTSNSGPSNWIVDTVSGCIARNPFPKTGESIRWYGQCVNTYISGYGKLEWYVNGQLVSYRQGYYELGYSEGYGVTTYIDKSYFVRHEGNSKSSMWNGYGTLFYPNNTKYIGNFLDGKRSGQGILYDSNDRVVQSGLWESNRFMGGKAIQNPAAPSNSSPDGTAQIRKKCIRLGLLPGTDDFNLCLRGATK